MCCKKVLLSAVLALCLSPAIGFSSLPLLSAPLSHHASRAGSPAVVTKALLALNVAIFVVQALSEGALTAAGAMAPASIAAGQYYRLFTPMFLHGSFNHLLVNCFSLNAVGPQVEAFYGLDRMSLVYLASGIAGNVLSCMMSTNMSVGASGAIFGLVGALGIFFARHQDMMGGGGKHALSGIGQTILLNMAMGLRPGSNIDNWGHLGGLIGGFFVGYLFGPNLKVKYIPGGRVVVDEPILGLPWKPRKAGKMLSTY